MKIGVPKEIKDNEYRIGMVPSVIRELVARGHRVAIQRDGGAGIGITDDDYRLAGAEIVDSPKEIFASADMIVKVKEPQPSECKMLREDQLLFTFLHLAPDPEQAQLLQKSGCSAIAYETVTDDFGGLPLLRPMSEVAGRMSIQAGAHCLEKVKGGSGVLLGGVPGVEPAKIVILGGGVVGTNALRIGVGMGARVIVIDRSLDRLRQLDHDFGSQIQTIYSTAETIETQVSSADLVIGAVLVPGAAAPKLVSRDILSKMRPGSVAVDVAIDQGGCFETSKPTTYSNPTFAVDDIIHYCVANIPGAVARTSAFALNNATMRHIINLADKGVVAACLDDKHLLNGLNVHRGEITHDAVAEALGATYVPPAEALQTSSTDS